MNLNLNGHPLPPGLDVTIGPDVYSYQSLLNMTEVDRLALGVEEVLPPEPEPLTLEQLKAAAFQNLADRRWQACQTFAYDGVITQADPAIPAVTAAVVSSQFLPPETVRTWKLATGEFRQWTGAQIIAFGMAISAHVQACFDIERNRSGLIQEATDLTALVAVNIDDGWP